MFQSIQRLRNNEYIPDTILDIGAYHGTWTDDCLKIYPTAKYNLFEAINYNQLNRFRNNNRFDVFNVILNNENKEVEWYEMKNTGDSIFKEIGNAFINCNPVIKQSYALDNILTNTTDMKNILIKIDCQGAEINILKGATNILQKVDFIILEMPFFGKYNENTPNFLEHIVFMDTIGFIPYDFLDSHHINNFNMQIDMMFINKNHSFNKIVQERLF